MLSVPLVSFKISGWILPDGEWRDAQEWWHLSTLYDLKDLKYPYLSSEKSKKVLLSGNENDIRNHVCDLGFIKISRSQIDCISMTVKQLSTLKHLISYCSPDDEFSIIYGNTGIIKSVSVNKINKLKNPDGLFSRLRLN